MLTLKGGRDIAETLTSHSAKNHSFSYRTDQGPLPVRSHNVTLSIKPGKNAGESMIVWRSSFDAKDGTKDHDARKMIEDTYDAGLGTVAEMLGS